MNEKKIKKVFYSLIILFILNLLPLRAISLLFAVIYIFLGIFLIYLTLISKIKGKLKLFLLLTGFSSASLILAMVHGFLEVWSLDILQIIFFYIGAFISPTLFLIGIIGTLIQFRKKQSSNNKK